MPTVAYDKLSSTSPTLSGLAEASGLVGYVPLNREPAPIRFNPFTYGQATGDQPTEYSFFQRGKGTNEMVFPGSDTSSFNFEMKTNKGNDAGTFTVGQGQKVRIVNRKTGEVYYEGEGPLGGLQAARIGEQLSKEQGKKANWRIETQTGDSGWTMGAQDKKAKRSLLGKIAGVVLPVAGALLGGPLGIGAVAGGALGGAAGAAAQGKGIGGILKGAALGGATSWAGGQLGGALGGGAAKGIGGISAGVPTAGAGLQSAGSSLLGTGLTAGQALKGIAALTALGQTIGGIGGGGGGGGSVPASTDTGYSNSSNAIGDIIAAPAYTGPTNIYAAPAANVAGAYKDGGETHHDEMARHLTEYQRGRGHKGPGQVKGIGSGQEDLIPAWLSDGEYVWSAQDVADLGDGSTDEGVRRLDKMRHMVRKQAGRKDIKKIAKPQKDIGHMLKAVGGSV